MGETIDYPSNGGTGHGYIAVPAGGADGTAGIVALLAAALEPRIASVVISGALSSFMDFMRVKIHEGMMDLVIPGVLHDFDIPDVVEYVGTFKVTLVKPKIF